MADQYYHGLNRKYITVFGSLFNDIYIDRVDAEGNTQKTIKVPLSYGPKEWYLARLKDNPDLAKVISRVVPRMAFNLVSFRYAEERKLNTTNLQKKPNEFGGTLTKMSTPVPYDLHIRLSILVRNADDGMRIIEQILPRFTPELTIPMKLIPEMNETRDIPIVLGNVEVEDTYEGFLKTDERVIVWNLDFIIKAFYYGPIGKSKVIKHIDLSFYGDISKKDFLQRIHIRPGLTEDGLPTNDPLLSIDEGLINKDDDYGFIFEYFGINRDDTPSIEYGNLEFDENGNSNYMPVIT
ncbi:hypothetical protein [Caulobacter phage Cr30]|uniref:hypothetical protein n=1 Tax=Caulobacter phage Cr30 TaxID=1357714 RepID=UPI0004A9B9AC|nr:hypothetical protein OZ74_gp258 [Caulobacter phage Cr30]AGS81085.1 hypothetical protein [Caulobacter phage Cr30]